jgi:RNA polymerase sigma-70 factor (ECF subfamily)
MKTTPVTEADYSNDAGLSRRAASGDREAQRELFRALRASVHGTLFRVLGSNEHMEDLVQDAFIEIFRSLPSYRGEALLSTWADRIAARVAFHYLRRLPRRLKEPEPPPLQLVASSEEQALHREGVKRLYAILRQIKPEYRVPFALFALDGRSMEEIAGIMGVTVVAAKNRVSRARHRVWDAARRDNVLAAYLIERGEKPDEDNP